MNLAAFQNAASGNSNLNNFTEHSVDQTPFEQLLCVQLLNVLEDSRPSTNLQRSIRICAECCLNIQEREVRKASERKSYTSWRHQTGRRERPFPAGEMKRSDRPIHGKQPKTLDRLFKKSCIFYMYQSAGKKLSPKTSESRNLERSAEHKASFCPECICQLGWTWTSIFTDLQCTRNRSHPSVVAHSVGSPVAQPWD